MLESTHQYTEYTVFKTFYKRTIYEKKQKNLHNTIYIDLF